MSCTRLPSIGQAAAASPVELELTLRVGHGLAVELESLARSLRRRKINKAVAGIAAAFSLEGDHCKEFEGVIKEGANVPREFIANYFHAHLLAHLKPKITDKVLIDPRLKFTHPGLVSTIARPASEATYQRVVFWSPEAPG